MYALDGTGVVDPELGMVGSPSHHVVVEAGILRHHIMALRVKGHP